VCEQVSRCGDGVVDVENGEQCDDGNTDIHDDCIGRLRTIQSPKTTLGENFFKKQRLLRYDQLKSKVKFGNCYSAFYMRRTLDQKRFFNLGSGS